MASHLYKLSVFEIIGALYGTIIVYWTINYICKKRRNHNNYIGELLSLIGRNSLLFLVIHSMDFMLYISDRITNYSHLDRSDGGPGFLFNLFIKYLILFVGYEIIIHVPCLKKIYT